MNAYDQACIDQPWMNLPWEMVASESDAETNDFMGEWI